VEAIAVSTINELRHFNPSQGQKSAIAADPRQEYPLIWTAMESLMEQIWEFSSPRGEPRIRPPT
jgi:hypothetical protein